MECINVRLLKFKRKLGEQTPSFEDTNPFEFPLMLINPKQNAHVLKLNIIVSF